VIIRPPKPRRWPDPFIEPIYGKRGPCALCGYYSNLTENHVPPEAVGNFDRWNAQSFLTASAAVNRDLYFGRRFSGGLRFRTICAECNNRLGGTRDKAIIAFFNEVRKLVESRLILRSIIHVSARPNHIYKGLLAHLVSANENGIPTAFDLEARDVFFGKRELAWSSWNLFYWIYDAHELFLMRNAYYTTWHPTVEVKPLVLLKFYPLAFMFTQEPLFMGFPNLKTFLRARDDEEVEIPLDLSRRDKHPFWPATATPNNIILLGGDSFGLIGAKD
jgi:hypothetical protein